MRLTAATLKGNWATVLLPVNKDDSIDYKRLEDEIAYFVETKVDGIYANGTACELHNQTEDEFYKVQEILAAKCNPHHIPFQVGVSHPFPAVTLQRIKNTIALQPSAYQFILPDWVITNNNEQLSFIQNIAAAADGIPLVLYNPPHAKLVLTPEQLKTLCDEVPALIGVKLAGGDDNWYRQMQWSVERFSVFVPGHFLASGVSKGIASGAYSNVACLSPRGAQWWWQLMQTDIHSALEVEKRVLLFFNEYIIPFKNKGYSNPALDKLLAAAGKWSNIGTKLRWPYQWIDEKQVEPVAKIARKYLPEFFTN
ncbi:MAG: dihydrodipicolinate synthase family protein [Chitinophagaceae bacterium]|nr:dihydrodipicolinate synthase family protein [Chitinophagaceae bacterium]